MTVQNLIYRFTLDTFKNGVQRILQGFQTGESVSRKMIISLVSGSESYELPLANITATMYVKRPSQESPSINACAIDSENNAILYDILNEDIAEAGIVEMQLKIIDSISGKVLISPKFGMEVWESNVDDSDAEESPTYTALEEALAQATAMKDSAIADLYIDDDTNIFTVVFGDGTTYTSTVIADAIQKIANVEAYSLKAEGYAIGEQNGVPVASTSPYYQNNAKYYAENAGTSATNAATSEANASASETNALASEQNAATSEANASASETNAATSEANASASATSASTSATNAATSEANALASEQNASASETNAATSETNAATSEANASTSETNAATSETNALAYSKTSQSYAVGGSGTRQGEDSDNAKYYKEVCEQIAGGLEGGFIPMGTILFEALPTASQDKKGWMYNISDEFVTDARFKDGSGKRYAAGTNVYLTADMLWDCLSGVVPTVNGKNGNSITLDGSDLLVTGYTKPSSPSAISTLDSINSALGKLEAGKDANGSAITALAGRMSTAEGNISSQGATLEVHDEVIPIMKSSIANSFFGIAPIWNNSTQYHVGDFCVCLLQPSQLSDGTNYAPFKVFRCIQDCKNILPTSTSGNLYWEEAALSSSISQINSNLIANEINVPTSSWVSDSTNPNYGYKAVISSSLYSNNFIPQYVDMIPYDGSSFFSDGETEAKGLLNQIIDISASGVTFYASAIPSVALKFRIGGQA